MKRNRRQAVDTQIDLLFQRRLREGLAILSVVFCVFLGISLASYHHNDPGWSSMVQNSQIANWAGRAGAWLADVVLYLAGYLGYTAPILLAYCAWQLFKQREEYESWYKYRFMAMRAVGVLMIVLGIDGVASLHILSAENLLPFTSGGIIGNVIGFSLLHQFNAIGATLLLFAAFVIGVTLFTGLSWLAIADRIGAWVVAFFDRIFDGFSGIDWKPDFKKWFASKPKVKTKKLSSKPVIERHQPEMEQDEPVRMEPLLNFSKPSEEVSSPEIMRVEPKIEISESVSEPLVEKPVINRPKVVKPKSSVVFEPALEGTLPPLDLLDRPDHSKAQGYTNAQLEEMSRLVELRLNDFNVEVKVVAVHPGPVVTRFELQLAAGTKVSKITGLAKDIARSLSVISVRVVEVIPGKSVIGLELPNTHRETVRLRELLASQRYNQARSPLSLAIGKDIAGHPVVVDLAKMPHLLVAGTTGSGKSVGLNAMLLSLLYKSTPRELRMILIDPKMLELSIYDDIPHLLTPVVTDMKEAANALRWCVAEMERRYRLMAAMGVRNITGFNAKVREAIKKGEPLTDPLWTAELPGDQPPLLEELPFIMVLADEFADMMMVVGKKVEELIARIAQKARAAGIHLILATQRPSVDVITGLIKANIPTRIAFQVSSKVDSRTILDQQGAEQLLGHGDMLYLPPGTAVPIRVHGAFVDDDEVHRVVDDLKRRGQPDYLEEVLEGGRSDEAIPGLAPAEGGDGEQDELYDQAVQIVTETRRASISSVQRRLKIGYNRAARLMESMEAAGVVGAMESNGSREVLAPPPPPRD